MGTEWNRTGESGDICCTPLLHDRLFYGKVQNTPGIPVFAAFSTMSSVLDFECTWVLWYRKALLLASVCGALLSLHSS